MPLGAFLCAFYCSPENNKSTLNCFRVDDSDLLKTFCNQYLGTGPHKIGTFYYKNHKEKPYTSIDNNMVFRFETFGAVFSTQIPCNSVQSPMFRTKF